MKGWEKGLAAPFKEQKKGIKIRNKSTVVRLAISSPVSCVSNFGSSEIW